MKRSLLTLAAGLALSFNVFAQQPQMDADASKLANLNKQMNELPNDKSLSDQQFFDKQKSLTDSYNALLKECEKKYKGQEDAWKAALKKAGM